MSKPFLSAVSLACLGILTVVAAGCTTAANPFPPAAATAVPSAAATTSSIQGIVWQWTSVTNSTTGVVTTVPTPEQYTISLHADGTLSGNADCNTFTGTYSQESGLIITLGASTTAYCGDASLDQQYLTLLGGVTAGGPHGSGGLALETAGGEQRMIFVNGGAAEE